MVATRSDHALGALPEAASDEERAVAYAKALARRAVLAWEGVGDAEGNVIEPGPDAIDALLDVWPIFEAFQLAYVSKGLLLEQEKNVTAFYATKEDWQTSTTVLTRYRGSTVHALCRCTIARNSGFN